MSEPITKPLRFWDDKYWHYLVHRHLGETLFYYVVRIRPFDAEAVRGSFEKLFKDTRFGSIRVFPLFGTWDLLIRAWLYPSVEKRFLTALDASLVGSGSIRAMHPFRVEVIEKRWYDKEDVDRELLASIEDQTIADVQTGKQIEKLNELIAGNLVLTRRRPNNIGFFIAINIESMEDAITDGIINGIKEYLKDAKNSIVNVSIYAGFGFCKILVKGEVQSYFNIAPFANWIGTTFRPYAVHTETYLVHSPTQVLGDETIGSATLLALHGKDLFVQSIVPDLYDNTFPKQEQVVRFLVAEAHQFVFTHKDRKLLRDYLMAFLNDDGNEMAKVILLAFFGLESCLNKHHKRFISERTGKPAHEVYRLAHLSEEISRPSLKHKLQVCAYTIKETDPDGSLHDLTHNWDDLPHLRNDVMHGNVDPMNDWDTILRRLIPYLPRLRALLRLMEETVGVSCTGTYF
jgi:hypothetical protein